MTVVRRRATSRPGEDPNLGAGQCADRIRVIPPDYRKLVTRSNGDVLPTLPVDGYVAGVWRPVEGGIEATAFHRLPVEAWEGLAAQARSEPGRTRLSWSVRQAPDAPCATSPMTAASSCGRDHIGQWLVGRST